jgi:hypothetical protein
LDSLLPDPEDDGTTIIRNVGNYLPVDTVCNPKRLESSPLTKNVIKITALAASILAVVQQRMNVSKELHASIFRAIQYFLDYLDEGYPNTSLPIYQQYTNPHTLYLSGLASSSTPL